jgi:Ser/Thr protein kinase RdoA (MazF antagonist)
VVTAPMRPDDAALREVLGRFLLAGGVESIAPAVEGHINRSWVITAGRPAAQYLLQLLNPHVFRAPDLVMENVAAVTRHLAAALARDGAPEPERRALRIVPTRDGPPFHRDAEGGVWRVYPFIARTVVREHVTTRGEAREVGRAFGTFQRHLAEYDGPRLHETIPGFHDTRGRVAALERAVEADSAGRASGARAELEALRARRPLAGVLADALAAGAVPERVAHNDAKSSNVLLDERTGEGLCVIDLDTVMPGSALHDFGDLVRSTTSPTAEDEPDAKRVAADPALFAGLAEGFLGAAGGILTAAERDLLVRAGQVITYEQAARFLTDHLDGDRYFRVAHPGHNLTRCRTQLALLESLEAQQREFERVIRER